MYSSYTQALTPTASIQHSVTQALENSVQCNLCLYKDPKTKHFLLQIINSRRHRDFIILP